ncbi:hypothetical protein SAMD00023353_3800030 [Rosellinia necatrix]|uniref:Ubiquitin-like protease family profile domain-containing protein n=1 Tax=Rosellinia necatrix TaxID=77044 RepID=A0A1W2TMD4_ROSNE|nr:hypothetical protein SAMD00023353_3800030 [Rosellinia necatrix]
MSRHRRELSAHYDDFKSKKSHISCFREHMGIEPIVDGNTEIVKHLLTRLYKTTATTGEELQVSPAEAQCPPKDQSYHAIPPAAVTRPSSTPPGYWSPFFDKWYWSQEICERLADNVTKDRAAKCFGSIELSAMLSTILDDQTPRIGFEENFAEVFGCQPKTTFGRSVVQKICHSSTDFFIFGGGRPAGSVDGHTIWYLIVVDIHERKLYIIDPVCSDHGVPTRRLDTLLHMRRLWEQDIYPKNPHILSPRIAIGLPLAQQTERANSGLVCIINAFILTRHPNRTVDLVKRKSNGFDVSRWQIKALEGWFKDRLHPSINTERLWSLQKSNTKQSSALVNFDNFDEPLVTLALSVQKGSWNTITSLLHSMYGGYPVDGSLRVMSNTIGIVQPCRRGLWGTLEEKFILGELPPRRTKAPLWDYTIGPRVANLLLHMTKHSRPSGLEISAYLHMVLAGFFVGEKMNPEVMIETTFGDFLTKDGPRNEAWDKLIMHCNPQFLVIRRCQQPAGCHWYVIVVETGAKRAYCFDSFARQDNRAEHIAAFAFLREEWAVRLPRIPAPERMIEVPSFIHKDSQRSSFLCIYHVALLFRERSHLWRLEHGNVTASKEDFDYVTQLAENYIRKFPYKTLNADDHGCEGDLECGLREGLKSCAASVKMAAEKHKSKKRAYKDTMVESSQEARSSSSSAYLARSPDSSRPGLRCPNNFLLAPSLLARHATPENRSGSRPRTDMKSG